MAHGKNLAGHSRISYKLAKRTRMIRKNNHHPKVRLPQTKRQKSNDGWCKENTAEKDWQKEAEIDHLRKN